MSDTKIEWATKVWNPIVGCTVHTPGCTNCYAMKMAARLERIAASDNRGLAHYVGTTKLSKVGAVWTGKIGVAGDDAFLAPLRRKKPTDYFVNSMSDLFHDAVPIEIIARVFNIMADSPQHTYKVLTKRSDRMLQIMAGPKNHRLWAPKLWHRSALPNVWLGVSVEDQARRSRIDDLGATPAATRFVSFEPLLGPVDACEPLGIWWNQTTGAWVREHKPKFDWAIVGGESGPGARPMANKWAQSLVDQCRAAGVAVFVKQLSSGGPKAIKDIEVFPERLRFREFPCTP